MSTIRVIEIVGAIWLTTAIFMLGRSYRWWLFYALANIPFSIVSIEAEKYGYALMGFVCCASGIRNYFIEKKKAIVAAKAEALSHLR